ncbi:Ribosomal protein S14, mitochondrial [Sesamum angolense]|uniref:Small ribosomal subunit protein uS14m n=1 Tax=Sesamum angolense TaxID=2727404 RepID=A0AAE2C4Z9_9LAMI|nr:Ribosomal protein S14, mitochondrial [Sesamum angolense]
MRGKLSKMSEKRNIRDHKRRLLAAKYELRRKLYKAFCKDPDLPSDMRDKHRYKLSKLPRNSSFARQDDQSESAGEKKRESAKNLSDSVTEQSDDSSVTQDDPTPSTLLSLYTTSEMFAFLSQVMVTRRSLELRNMLTKTSELRVRSVEGTTLSPRKKNSPAL